MAMLCCSLPAQVMLGGGDYRQDFNSLTNAGAASWTDDSTLPGWYASRSAAPNTIVSYVAGNGSGTAGGLYSFGSGGSGERALGSIASGGTGKIAFGVRLVNDSDTPLSSFVVSYTGEQWRVGGPARQVLAYAFQVGLNLTNADAAGDQNWTPVEALNFNSPSTNGTEAIDGNKPANQATFASIPLPGVVLPPGEELFLRWLDVDDTGYDDGLAIDDLRVQCSVVDTTSVLNRPGDFSLLTYNTHGHDVENWSTNSSQVRAIGRQLLAFRPDIVALNEIPVTNTWQMENWVKAFMPGYFLATNSADDGAIHNVIASRFPITRSQSWLHDSDLTAYGATNATFRRDLFEAEIAVPGFSQPLHVFSVHLKSSQDTASATQRGAEAGVISNFFVSGYLTSNSLQPYVVCGDMNEDIVRPPNSNPESIQTLISPATGLRLTTPVNPVTGSELTFSTRTPALSKRYDYVLPCALLLSNIVASEVFRTDLMTNLPAPLHTNDDITGSDHLPVMVTFRNPYAQPFRLFSIGGDNCAAVLTWQSVPGQCYRVQLSGDFRSWTTVQSNFLATNMQSTCTIEVSGPTHFFRVTRE